MDEIIEFFNKLFEVESWPPRWRCGVWSDFHGWLYIISDLVIWLSYFAIPVIILIYLSKKKFILFPNIFLLSAAFILACGFTHLVDAIIFWHPIYRISALVRLFTAGVSVATVFALIKVLPVALSLKSPEEFNAEIFKREKVETELATSERRFYLAMKATNDAIWDWPDINMENGWWSSRFYELLGYENGEMEPTQENFFKILHPDDRLLTAKAMENNVLSGHPFDVEYRLKTKANGYRWFRGRGNVSRDDKEWPKRMIGSISDIHEQKGLEEKLKTWNSNLEREVEMRTIELKKTKELYEDLYNNAPEMYISIGAENEELMECNETFLRKTGFQRDELIGEPVRLIYQEESMALATEAFSVFRKTGSIVNQELILKSKAGECIEVLLNATAAFDENGKIVKSRTSMQDVTQLNKAQRRIVELNKQLQAQVVALTELNQELESFSYSVSHDLRSPLRAINGFAGTIKMEMEDRLDPEMNRMLGKIQSNSRRMGMLIDDLLQFSQMGRVETKFQDIDMNQLVKQVMSEIRESQPDREIRFELKSLPEAYGDRSMIKQVWYNLISNGIKYSSRSEEALIQVGSSVTAENQVVYFVKDNGIGFNMKYSHKLFKVFERLHETNSIDGTGIGLALVKRIIDRHNGKVWADSKINHGATFYFSLHSIT